MPAIDERLFQQYVRAGRTPPAASVLTRTFAAGNGLSSVRSSNAGDALRMRE